MGRWYGPCNAPSVLRVGVIIPVLLLVLPLTQGCTQARGPVPQAVDEPPQARAERALARLAGAHADRFTVVVVPGSALEAHGWTNGKITVTAGLAHCLRDEELAAVIAHEMGHMIADGHFAGEFDLNGCCRDPDAEQTADAIGTRLLESACVQRSAMVSMLTKLRAVQPPDSVCSRELAHRIERLEGRRDQTSEIRAQNIPAH